MRKKVVLGVLMCITSIGCRQAKGQERTEGLEVKKPNIIYVLTDQWRVSAFSYAGNPDVQTPHMDKLAKEAVNFANAVSVAPVCTPHRAALLTGRPYINWYVSQRFVFA